MELNEKLRELRIRSNMSQEQLAEQLHVTRQTVSKWEQGINQPDIYTLKQYSTIFGVSLDELVGDVSQTTNAANKRRKASKIIFLISTLLYIFSAMLIFVLWRFVQDTVPMHWDISGNIDRYANKVELLIHLLPLTVLYVISLITFLTGKKNLGKPLPNLATVSFVVIFSIVLSVQISYLIFMLCVTAEYLITDTLLQFIYCVIGAFVFVIGIATHPKITPQNTIIGMRTNFTLTNRVAWNKTNTLASICIPVAALIMIAINMIFSKLWITLTSPLILLVAAAIVYIYEEILKHKMKNNYN